VSSFFEFIFGVRGWRVFLASGSIEQIQLINIDGLVPNHRPELGVWFHFVFLFFFL